MSISTVGAWGTAGAGTPSSASTMTFTTATTALTANENFGLLIVISQNVSDSDGETNLHTSVTGGTGTWTKLGEYTNSNGSAGDGVTASLWLFEATGTVSVGTELTVNFASSITHKCASGHVFSKDTDKGIRLVPGADRVLMGTDGVNGYGSAAITGLASKQYLFVRALGKFTSNATNITPTSGFGTFATSRTATSGGRNVRGERMVATATGATSDPTYANAADTASVFVALEEFTPESGSIIGTMSEQIDMTLSSTGTSLISGLSDMELELMLSSSSSAGSKGEAFPTLTVSLEASGTSVITGTGGGELLIEMVSTEPVFGSLSKVLEFVFLSEGRMPITGEGSGNLNFFLESVERLLPIGALSKTLEFELESQAVAKAKGQASSSLVMTVWARGSVRLPGFVILASYSREGHWRAREDVGTFHERQHGGSWKERVRTGRWG